MGQKGEHECIRIKEMAGFNNLDKEEQIEVGKKVSICETCKFRWRRWFKIDR